MFRGRISFRQGLGIAAGLLITVSVLTGVAIAGGSPTTVPSGPAVVQDVVVRPAAVVPQQHDLVVQTTTVVPMPQPAQQPAEAVQQAPAPQAAADEPTTEPVEEPTFTHPPFIPSYPGETAIPAPPEPSMCRITDPDTGRAVFVPPGPDGTCKTATLPGA